MLDFRELPQVRILMPSMLSTLCSDSRVAGAIRNLTTFVYPDGSAEIAGKNVEEADSLIRARLRELSSPYIPNAPPVGLTYYRGYLELPEQWYYVWCWDKFVYDLDDNNCVMIMPTSSQFWRAFSPIDRFEVSFILRRLPNKGDDEIIATALSAWIKSVANEGVNGEGQVRSISNGVTFRGKICSFVLDVSKSGQKTLNSLILHLLHLASSVTITDMDFFGPQSVRERFGEQKRKPYTIEWK